MLTGDDAVAALRTGTCTGVNTVISETLPQPEEATLKDLMDSCRRLGMVDDGVKRRQRCARGGPGGSGCSCSVRQPTSR